MLQPLLESLAIAQMLDIKLLDISYAFLNSMIPKEKYQTKGKCAHEEILVQHNSSIFQNTKQKHKC